MPLLTGQFARSLDEKQRVAIPKRLREAMECDAGAFLYVAPGLDGSLVLYAEGGFQKLADRLAEAPPTQQDVRAFNRLFYSLAERVEVDGQGRVRIPAQLAQLAGFDKEVVLVGARDHLELWAKPRWEQYMAEKQPQYDAIAEAAFHRP